MDTDSIVLSNIRLSRRPSSLFNVTLREFCTAAANAPRHRHKMTDVVDLKNTVRFNLPSSYVFIVRLGETTLGVHYRRMPC